MARLARQTYALLVSLLPATATVIGLLVLAQLPTPVELAGLALVSRASPSTGSRPSAARRDRAPDAGSRHRPARGRAARRRPRRGSRRRRRWPPRRPSGRSARASTSSRTAWRAVRPRSMRESTGTPFAVACCSIASSSGSASSHCARKRGVQRQAHRHAREVGGDERRALGAGDPQRGVERGLRQRLADEREQHAPVAHRRRRARPHPPAGATSPGPRREPRPAARPGRSPGPSSVVTSFFPPRAVGHDPHVDPGQRVQQAHRQRFAQAPQRRARRAAGPSGRRSSRGRAPRGAPPRRRRRPSPPAGARRASWPAGAARRAARPRPRPAASPLADAEQVELGAEPLGRAPRPAHDPLRAGLGRDEGEQPLADRLRRRAAAQPVLAGADAVLSRTSRLDSTSSATWRSATSRSAARFSTLKKPLSAAGIRGGRVDLAGLQAASAPPG